MRINRVLLLLSTALLSLQPAFAGGFSPQTWGALRPERPSSFALINHALADGSLSRDEWALLQAYALLAHDRLPLPYLMGGKEKCGTWVLAEISRHWASLSENTRRSMMSLGFTPQGTLARPPGLDSTRSSAHFVIHYSTAPGDRNAVPPTDADGNGTPDYIDTVLSVMEYVWSVEIGNLGYTAPPPDGSAGGDNRYDVYIFDLEPDLYGYNQEDVRIGDNPNSGSVVETNAYTSYLVLRNNYSGFGAPGETPVEALKVTAAHEFYHGVQAGYDGNEADWLAEATATWCEGQVYGSIKENYAYLPSWFAHPEYPLDASDYTADTLLYGFDHWYGSWIFFEDISENTAGGTTTVRQVLERTLAYDNIHADYSFQEVGDALASSGSTFGIVFHDFTAANASLIDPPLRYRDGGNYPPIGRTVITHDTTIGGTLPRRASSYYQIAPSMLPDCTQLLTVSFTSNDPVASQSIQLVVFAGGGGYSSEQQFPATITLSPTAIPDSIFIIVLSQGGTVSSGSYTLSISSQPRPGAYMITDLGVLPAPGSTVGGLNNRGSVVLNVQTYSPGSQDNSVWLWHGGSEQLLSNAGRGYDINDSDAVVGSVLIPYPTGGVIATLWGAHGALSIDTSGVFGAFGINNAGTVVGAGAGTTGAFLWSNGALSSLPRIQDSTAGGAEAFDINEGGDVVGVNGTHEPGQPHSQGPYHGVLWHGGSASDLGENVFPVKINDHGTYAGYVYVDVQLPNGSISNFAHAMLGPGRDIGTLFGAIGSSVAKDINNNGDVVGYSTTLPGNHAFLYSHGAMVDLNTMLAAGACWTLQEADAINDSGQIAGLGTPANDPSHTHGFLLTPTGVTVGIPHVVGIPSSFALYQNYPNPFNPSTTISYQLAAPSTVSLTIYDVLGREVQKLRNDVEIAGRHSVTWAASRFASGVYMVRLKAAPISGSRGDFVATERMLLVK